MKDLYLILTKTLQYPADLDRTEHGAYTWKSNIYGRITKGILWDNWENIQSDWKV